MNTIVIPVNTSIDAYAMLGDLKAAGLRAGKDFTWAYMPRKTDYFSYEETQAPHVTITFFEESLTSYYRLKWQ